MKMITVRFANGDTIQAPAKGKVLERGLFIPRRKKWKLLKKNEENMKNSKHVCTVDFDEIARIERENMKYYESLPRWYNYNKKGEIVNNYMTRDEWEIATFGDNRRKFNKRGKK